METQLQTPSQHPDTTAISLNRLLSRLEQVLLSPESSAALRGSSFERARIGANVEYARTLLLNLEHSAATSTTPKAKKTTLQNELQQKRQLLKQLNQRLLELNELDDENFSGDSTDSDEDPDTLPSYAPKVQEEAGIEYKGGQGNQALAAAAENLTAELRRRGKAEQGGVTATGTALFPQKATTTTGIASTEALMSHNREEQEALTNSLLGMAKQLKEQSIHFGNTLESDKSILDRAVQGLDKSTLGMEAAGQKMGALRRMTEGKGWWARLRLYALIFGLWVAAFLIVFVGPKIRL